MGRSRATPATAAASRDGKRLAIVAIILVLGLIGGGFGLWDRRGPHAATAIFDGIVYGSVKLDETPEGRGLVHWLRIDLTAPGIELYVTALDPTAIAQGWQYRLRRIGDVVDKQHLAVAINGTYFTSEDRWLLRMSGDLANSVETVVADHVVSHTWEHNYLLSFDEQLTPYLSRSSRRLRQSWPRRNGVSADRRYGHGMAKSGQGAIVHRTRELRWPSIVSKNCYLWRWANTSRHADCYRS